MGNHPQMAELFSYVQVCELLQFGQLVVVVNGQWLNASAHSYCWFIPLLVYPI
jgi:hypothetical protein